MFRLFDAILSRWIVLSVQFSIYRAISVGIVVTCCGRVTIGIILDIVDMRVVIEKVCHAVAAVYILSSLGVVSAHCIAIANILVIAVVFVFVAVVMIQVMIVITENVFCSVFVIFLRLGFVVVIVLDV